MKLMKILVVLVVEEHSSNCWIE
ncbi:hypothetical protein AGR1C_Lc80192 [Agrobacterium fabacearum TT111]|nr:hypothetical protein AGR1C_Lc80192 [Agrobacterium fabacearum TT111]